MATETRKGPSVPLPLIIGGIVAVLVVLALLALIGIGLFNMFQSGGYATPIPCSASAGCSFWHPVIYSLILLIVLLTGFAYTTLLERKFIAWFQQRRGPNRVGPGGFLQPAADGVKLIFKEDIMPSEAYPFTYRIAPILKAAPVLIVMAVIPLGPPITIPWFDGNWYSIPLSIADPTVGILWILAITSIGTYGVVLAGWSSNNKYAMLGGLRATAQMISYELALGLSMLVPVMIAGSMSIRDIIDAQGGFFLNWFVFQNPLAAAILMIAFVAEINRAPFDLPEAEQELTAGFMTEYSGMKFAMFMMAEYLGMIAISLVTASLFFGGYSSGFGIEAGAPIIGVLVMIGKVVLMLIGLIWVRATLPRIRYDRLMTLGWKVLLPLALLSVCWTAIAVVIGDALGPVAYTIVAGLLFLLIIGGVMYATRGTETEEAESDIENDPVITGERTGAGFMALQVVGGLIAIPFALFGWLVKVTESLAELGQDEPEPEPEVPAAETTAIVPAEESVPVVNE